MRTSVRGESLILHDDFEDGNARDGTPVSWEGSDCCPGKFFAQGGDLVVEDDVRDAVVTGVYADRTFQGDITVRTQVRFDGNVGVSAHFTNGTGYLGTLRGPGEILLRRFDPEFDSVILDRAFADTPLDPGMDYTLQLEIQGGRVEFRAWKSDQPMPAERLSASDVTYRSGVSGLTFFNGDDASARARFRYFSVSTGTNLFDDFSDGDPFDGVPIPWIPFGECCCEGSFSADEGHLEFSALTQPFTTGLYIDRFFDGDLTIRAHLTLPAGGGSQVGIFVHFAGDCGEEEGYWIGMRTCDEIAILRWDGSGFPVRGGEGCRNGNAIAAEPFEVTSGEEYILECNVRGDLIEVRASIAEDWPPESPVITLQDSTHRSGYVGLHFTDWDINDGLDDRALVHSFEVICPAIGTGTQPDCNQNSLPDDVDISSDRSQDSNENGIPDECEGVLVVSTDTIEFGEVPLGESRMASFDLHNTGPAAVRVTLVRIGSPHVPLPHFELTEEFEPVELDPGESATYGVAYAPTEAEPNEGTLTVMSDAVTGAQISVRLVGTGTDPRPSFRRGDCNGDGAVDISDPVFNLEVQFLGKHDPGCLAALDTNADGVMDLSDPVYNLEHQFLGKPAPPPPYPDCGPENLPAGEALSCETRPANCP